MLARTRSMALVGAEARLVDVEVSVSSTGLPGFSIVGLPAKSVREAEHRVHAAVECIDEKWPGGRKVANLAPGGLRKEGAHFDLALAVGVLAANNAITHDALDGWIVAGELGFDGSVRPVRGVLAAAIAARRAGARGLICPHANAPEASLVDGIETVAVKTLQECVGFLRGSWTPPAPASAQPAPAPAYEDMSEVRGHSEIKQTAEIVAAGGHNLLLIGAPGSGKTMLASRLPGILPSMSADESLDTTCVYSVAGLLNEKASLITARPFRSPHHNVSPAGLIGGGPGLPRPGEISLAHNGVLFLDELTLYRRDVLESLRAPLEEGCVRIARSGGVIRFPSRFSLVAAMNPCPCGYSGDRGRECGCSAQDIARYNYRLSGPLMDRIDISASMYRPARHELMAGPAGESSAAIRERVEMARLVQGQRYGSVGVTNASCPAALLHETAELSPRARELLSDALDGRNLSARGMVRSVRVARTIADLAGSAAIAPDHMLRALGFRMFRELQAVGS
ncbi:MAG: YifB family Mg chelatase-like AAA ATPase [Actinomycetota bacterium]